MRSFLFALIPVFLFGACATTPTDSSVWPTVQALPEAPPAGLSTDVPAPMLSLGEDGFVWLVGALPENVQEGAGFVARYSGDWPIAEMPRPALAFGRVARRVGPTAAVVNIEYQMPDAKLEGLEVSWTEVAPEIGKGLATVAGVSKEAIELKIKASSGIRKGDVYGVVGGVSKNTQLSRRIKTVCLVESVESEVSRCRPWQGSKVLGPLESAAVADSAVFLEHTYGLAPREATIAVLEAGKDGEKLREMLIAALTEVVDSVPQAQVKVQKVAGDFDARRADFHHASQMATYDGHAQMVVGLSVADVDGVPHLFGNYAGVGPVSGPGMVAAPPDHGVDLGPVAGLSPKSLRAFATVVLSGVQIYRGQTSETLVLLKQLLNEPSLRGPLRWHVRDQFAMRWLGLGHFSETMWLIQEDMALGQANDNQAAYLNALGTVVRLYDQRDLPQKAVALSEEYLKARASEKPDAPYRAALSMHIEMLLAADRVDEARAGVTELEALCPTGCDGDLVSMLSAAFWAAPQQARDFQAELLARITVLAEAKGGDALAALRVHQGMNAMGEGNLEEALIGFLEAERLYEGLSYAQGVARARFFRMMTEIARREPDSALVAGLGAIELQRELQDFGDVSLIYERLAQIYTSFNPNDAPGPYLASAAEVLAENVQSALSSGNYAKASEALFSMASFLGHMGQLDDAKTLLRRAVGFSLDAARFEVTALCHLSLAHIARVQGNAEEFAREVANARLMAEVSGDESVKDMVKRSLTPPEPEPEDPTRLL